MDSLPDGYDDFLQAIKQRVSTAQVRAALSVNQELVLLYWSIGQEILSRQRSDGWGTKVIDRLSHDLKSGYPEISGFSSRNLKYMRAFAEAYPDEAIVQQAAAQIPWFHNVVLIEKVKDPDERLWYAMRTIEHGWSRNVLIHQIESDLFRRQGGAISNFHATLPAPQSDLAHAILKDPYVFDFLQLTDDARERKLEQALIDRVEKFLLELGVGFALLGRQYHLDVGGEDFYLDLLFYHHRLRCLVVIDLKGEKFKPEFAGKMQFYLSVVDDLVRHPDDGPSIGLIICKDRNRVIAEYTLKDTRKPISVAEYVLTTELPQPLRDSLPTVALLEGELTGSPAVEPAVQGDSEIGSR
jgi:predicted nuclease of restriction endonuclease-like (RecB) superfamily